MFSSSPRPPSLCKKWVRLGPTALLPVLFFGAKRELVQKFFQHMFCPQSWLASCGSDSLNKSHKMYCVVRVHSPKWSISDPYLLSSILREANVAGVIFTRIAKYDILHIWHHWEAVNWHEPHQSLEGMTSPTKKKTFNEQTYTKNDLWWLMIIRFLSFYPQLRHGAVSSHFFAPAPASVFHPGRSAAWAEHTPLTRAHPLASSPQCSVLLSTSVWSQWSMLTSHPSACEEGAGEVGPERFGEVGLS